MHPKLNTIIFIFYWIGTPVSVFSASMHMTSQEEIYFYHYHLDDSLECSSLTSQDTNKLSKKEALFVINNCETLYISILLEKMNRNLFLHDKKPFSIEKKEIKSDLSKLNIGFFNLYSLKKPKTPLSEQDIHSLFDSSGLYFYYAFLLSTKSTYNDSQFIRTSIKRIADQQDLNLEKFFGIRTSPVVYFELIESFNNFKNIEDYFESNLWKFAPEKLHRSIMIELNSKELRNYLFKSISNLNLLQALENFSEHRRKEIVGKLKHNFHTVVLLSYLSKDKELLKELLNKKFNLLLNKDTLFLLKKFEESSFSRSYIQFHRYRYLINFGGYYVPDVIKKYRII
ncbi:hypothetical protein KKB55_09250 [Myxococcota bacterium]|nr:hypothetical protein [Myxococcota bacterium]MBU1897921.1 hypothetical protein [Myxococcota bacterium]